MTARSHSSEPGPAEPLSAPVSASDPEVGTERHPGGAFGPQTGTEGVEGEPEVTEGGLPRQQDAAAEHRLRLAHSARRAKEHQLDEIRRALCDIGFMEDDDPYSHADLADVIRQVGSALADEQATCVHPEGYEGECPCPPSCVCCQVEAPAWTTPDNPSTSGDTSDNSLREQLDEARMWARHGYEIGQKHCSWTDHGVAPAWLTEGWPPHFGSCEHLVRAAEYDEALARVRALADQWQAAMRPGEKHPAAQQILAALGQAAPKETA